MCRMYMKYAKYQEYNTRYDIYERKNSMHKFQFNCIHKNINTNKYPQSINKNLINIEYTSRPVIIKPLAKIRIISNL